MTDANTRISTGFLGLIAVLGACTCTRYDSTNPADPTYRGDYALSLATASLPDTAEVLTPYRVGYTEGSERFAYLLAEGVDNNVQPVKCPRSIHDIAECRAGREKDVG